MRKRKVIRMQKTNLNCKRLVLISFDVFACLVLAATTLPLFSNVAWAYVDPSVMTYTIQALAGVAVALSTVLGVAFRRTRKKLVKALGIDENAGKEVDPAWCRVDENGNPIIAEEDLHTIEARKTSIFVKKEKGEKKEDKGIKPGWFRRFILSLIVCTFGGFTLGIVAPYEIVAGAGGSLSFALSDIAIPMAVFTIIAILITAIVLSLFRGKLFTVLLALAFAVSLCFYIQAMFMNNGLPSADGREVDFWGDHKTMMIVSLIVWIVLIVGIALVSNINRSRFQGFAAAISIVLIFVQAVGVGSLFANQITERSYSSDLGPTQITEDGMNEVSSKNNVIMFVLDRFDTKTMDSVLQEYPDALNEWQGFTYFHNSNSVMIPTNNAIPYMLTGVHPDEGEDLVHYRETRYQRSTFLKDMHDSNYSVGIYSPDLQLNKMSDEDSQKYVASNTINIHPLSSMKINVENAVKSLIKCSLYRDAPWVFKERFRFYTDDINRNVISYQSDGSPADTVHVTDDVRYYEKLKDSGITVDDRGYNGAFRLIHLNGDHDPYYLNENAEDVGVGNSDETTQARAAIHIVNEYLKQLKEKGLYDNATIIITSDHGNWHSSEDLPDYATTPIMFAKKSGTGEGNVVRTDSPVSHSQLMATILSAMGQNYSKYGSTIFEDDPSMSVRDFWMISSDGRYSHSMFHYKIEGDSTDFNNWHFTGETLVGGKA